MQKSPIQKYITVYPNEIHKNYLKELRSRQQYLFKLASAIVSR